MAKSLSPPLANKRCFWCDKEFTPWNFATKDHLFPKSTGGKTTVIACLTCNHFKGNMEPLTFIEWLRDPKNIDRLNTYEGKLKAWYDNREDQDVSNNRTAIN